MNKETMDIICGGLIIHQSWFLYSNQYVLLGMFTQNLNEKCYFSMPDEKDSNILKRP